VVTLCTVRTIGRRLLRCWAALVRPYFFSYGESDVWQSVGGCVKERAADALVPTKQLWLGRRTIEESHVHERGQVAIAWDRDGIHTCQMKKESALSFLYTLASPKNWSAHPLAHLTQGRQKRILLDFCTVR
jgi:hypothetical protein